MICIVHGIFPIRPALVFLLIYLTGCAVLAPHRPGIGDAVSWKALPGWETDRHAEGWPAFLQSCRRLEDGDRRWRALCAEARALEGPGDGRTRAFFEAHFTPHLLWDDDGDREGLITGYYEPVLEGSRVRTPVFRYPVYGEPKDLLTMAPGGGVTDRKERAPRGRLADDGRVIPYFSRAEIHGTREPLKGNEIAWVHDPVALFFLHIQGSGRIQLRDGTLLGLEYANRNGHPYVSIGRVLIENGAIAPEEMSMQAIRDWLRANPHRLDETLNCNPSYIFFAERHTEDGNPAGSLGVPLTPRRSIAVDAGFIPPGLPVWMDTTLPGEKGQAKKGKQAAQGAVFRRLVFAQDTGSAIRGPVRADLFWGSCRRTEDYGPPSRAPPSTAGDKPLVMEKAVIEGVIEGSCAARYYAGRMRQRGRLYVLLPRE
ncbi:MAG: membrane-bound lytic murein transglycosylase A [Candidatus Kentron sp. G]|nr:MAG: membrane-bound lytic murein transglycosylase A [Candidatus Kentron sp. G]VFN02236.1 MAG: membrane-bound lytic murein transglycosylase A [Candidatus Kentron sp. G]VFN03743.1 MAG: membrane-bound lytic murein transglycosylase A [Candidatus Kentron sp. G]